MVETVHHLLKALQKIIPGPTNFSRKVKNPCWENGNDGTLNCMPYFFLAGFPKCGTTTVHNILTKHPQISPPQVKEGHWWVNAQLKNSDIPHVRKAVLQYFNNFHIDNSHSDKQLITYDGSASTLWQSPFMSKKNLLDYCAVPAIISRILPDAKFIVMMRNPTTREFSNYLYACNGVNEREWPTSMQADPAQYFHTHVAEALTLFNNCLKTENN